MGILDNKLLLKGSLLLAFVSLLSRATGFLREMTILWLYGANEFTDMLLAWLVLPDFIASLLVGGLVVAFLQKTYADANSLGQAYCELIIVFLLLSVPISLLLYMNIESFSAIILSSLEGGRKNLFAYGLGWIILFIPLSVLALASVGLQLYKERFFVANFGNVLFNLGIVSGLIFLYLLNAELLYFIVIIAVSLLLRIAYVAFHTRHELSLFQKVNMESVFRLAASLMPLIFSGIGLFVLMFYIRTISSSMGAGYFSYMTYGLKFVELFWVFVVGAIGLVLTSKVVKEPLGRKKKSALKSLFIVFVALVASTLVIHLTWMVFESYLSHEVRESLANIELIDYLEWLVICGGMATYSSSLVVAIGEQKIASLAVLLVIGGFFGATYLIPADINFILELHLYILGFLSLLNIYFLLNYTPS